MLHLPQEFFDLATDFLRHFEMFSRLNAVPLRLARQITFRNNGRLSSSLLTKSPLLRGMASLSLKNHGVFSFNQTVPYVASYAQ